MKIDLKQIFNVETNGEKPMIGRVLISEPFANDDLFRHSVVYIVAHSLQGTMGFVLNKYVRGAEIGDLVNKIFESDLKIRFGGPVSRQQVFFMYLSSQQVIEDSVLVKNNLYITDNFEQVKKMVLLRVLNPDNVILFNGYASWTPGQLDQEIANNYWLVSDISTDEVVNCTDNLWNYMINKMDKKYQIWNAVPENPFLN